MIWVLRVMFDTVKVRQMWLLNHEAIAVSRAIFSRAVLCRILSSQPLVKGPAKYRGAFVLKRQVVVSYLVSHLTRESPPWYAGFQGSAWMDTQAIVQALPVRSEERLMPPQDVVATSLTVSHESAESRYRIRHPHNMDRESPQSAQGPSNGAFVCGVVSAPRLAQNQPQVSM
jgi:hypothetical protein